MENTRMWPGWECVDILGIGSYGKVYEIQKIEHGKTYKAALKVISVPQNDAEIENVYSEGMTTEEITQYFESFVKDFATEIALMSELKGYTNIVSYEDHMVVEHEDKIGWDILIRMELLIPLLKWERENPMAEKDIIKLGCDVCRALELCHKNNIIHRDIKPENIFVNKSGDFKLGDFGIARVTEKTTSAMSKKGTYSYMAPEVYEGMEYNETVDIYSLGIVLYRFLNRNRTPFLPFGDISHKDREDALLRRMSGEIIPAPANGNPQLNRIILKAIQYSPENRYQNAQEFYDDLAWYIVSKESEQYVINDKTMKSDEGLESEETIRAVKDTKKRKKYNWINLRGVLIGIGIVIAIIFIIGNSKKTKLETEIPNQTNDIVHEPQKTSEERLEKSEIENKGTLDEETISAMEELGISFIEADSLVPETVKVGPRAIYALYPSYSNDINDLKEQIEKNKILLWEDGEEFYYEYELPQDVSSLMNHGWEIIWEEMNFETLESDCGCWCVMEKKNSRLNFMVYNDSLETKKIEECMIVGVLGIRGQIGDNFRIHGDINYDSTISKICSIYGDYVDSYKNEEGTTYYVWNDTYNLQIMKKSNGYDALLILDPNFSEQYNLLKGQLRIWNFLW